MASFNVTDATTMLQLAILLVWTCISTTPVYSRSVCYLTVNSRTAVEQLFSLASLTFAPGLFETLSSAVPPTIAYFKRLPTVKRTKRVWAVYLLVLEKGGWRPQIYIGSATMAEKGVTQRFWAYNNGVQIPLYVQDALNDGYTITHKGLLCTTPLPADEDVVKVRRLFLALEAAFTFALWAIRVVNTGFGMSGMLQWDTTTLEYDGLCSHSSLKEGPSEADEDTQILSRNHAKTNKTHYCKTCDHSFITKEKLTIHLAGKRHAGRLKGGDKAAKRRAKNARMHQRRKQKAQNERQWFCETCNVLCVRQDEFDRHNSSASHLSKIANATTDQLPISY